MPVRIGEFKQLNDGLVGYWNQQDGQPDKLNSVFHALQSNAIDDPFIKTRVGRHADAAHHPDRDFHLNLSVADGPRLVTMLLDPRGSVHATSGVLPTKQITLPTDQYAKALESLEVTFLTAPLLTPQGQITVSVPNEPGYQWSWLHKEADQWRELGTVGGVAAGCVRSRIRRRQGDRPRRLECAAPGRLDSRRRPWHRHRDPDRPASQRETCDAIRRSVAASRSIAGRIAPQSFQLRGRRATLRDSRGLAEAQARSLREEVINSIQKRPMQNVTLEFTLDEVNLILDALGQQPYIKVSQVIAKIQQQGRQTQLQNDDTPEEPNE